MNDYLYMLNLLKLLLKEHVTTAVVVVELPKPRP